MLSTTTSNNVIKIWLLKRSPTWRAPGWFQHTYFPPSIYVYVLISKAFLLSHIFTFIFYTITLDPMA